MYTPQALFERLDELGIKYATYEHAPAFSVKDAYDIIAHLPPCGPCRNLFLKDKRDHFYLVTALFETKISIKDLQATLSAQGLHFASSDQLFDILGVTPGSVTPFGLINDRDHRVTVVLDQEIFAYEYIGIHPMINTATTLLSPADLQLFIESCGTPIVSHHF